MSGTQNANNGNHIALIPRKKLSGGSRMANRNLAHLLANVYPEMILFHSQLCRKILLTTQMTTTIPLEATMLRL